MEISDEVEAVVDLKTASMRPSSFEDGNDDSGVLDERADLASMRPSSFEDGNTLTPPLVAHTWGLQ